MLCIAKNDAKNNHMESKETILNALFYIIRFMEKIYVFQRKTF